MVNTDNIKICCRQWKNWSKDIRNKLAKLTLKSGSIIKDIIIPCYKFNTIVIFRDKEILGWCVFTNDRKCHYKNIIMVYVNTKYRRLGVGSTLVEKAVQKLKFPKVIIYNRSSKAFYTKMQKLYPILRIIDNCKCES